MMRPSLYHRNRSPLPFIRFFSFPHSTLTYCHQGCPPGPQVDLASRMPRFPSSRECLCSSSSISNPDLLIPPTRLRAYHHSRRLTYSSCFCRADDAVAHAHPQGEGTDRNEPGYPLLCCCVLFYTLSPFLFFVRPISMSMPCSSLEGVVNSVWFVRAP
jgi:hypothetical protein